jgi:hypothetical protein
VEQFELAGEIEHGQALFIATDPVSIPAELVDEHARRCIKVVTDACRILTANPRLRASQLFDL